MLEPEVKMCFIKFWAEMYHAVRANMVNDAIDRLVQENKSLEVTVEMLEEAVKGVKTPSSMQKGNTPPLIPKSSSGLLGPL